MSIKSPLEHFELNVYTYLYNFYYDLSLNSAVFYLASLVLFLLLFHTSIFFP